MNKEIYYKDYTFTNGEGLITNDGSLDYSRHDFKEDGSNELTFSRQETLLSGAILFTDLRETTPRQSVLPSIELACGKELVIGSPQTESRKV